jgi:hypothetical protein
MDCFVASLLAMMDKVSRPSVTSRQVVWRDSISASPGELPIDVAAVWALKTVFIAVVPFAALATALFKIALNLIDDVLHNSTSFPRLFQ